MTEIVRHGGCRCGAVRYEIRGEPYTVGICHCTDCRSATGSAFLFYADWEPGEISISGEYATYEGRRFCPVCGSRLFHVSERHAEINLGSLDDAPTDLTPTREGWIKRREHWLAPVAGTYQAQEDPPASA